MINIGVIGCGKIAQVRHLPEYASHPSVRISGVCDAEKSRAVEVAERYHTKAYASYEDMLKDENVDAVSVCTANHSHCEITLKALEAGKHVLCEKPMAVTYAECKEMVETAKRTGRFLMIGHNQRLAKAHRKAKELVEKGEIGRIITFKSTFGHSGPENWAVDKNNIWFFNKSAASFGAMADLGVHKTDLIQFLLSDRIKEVLAVTGTLDKKDNQGNAIGVDDNAICIYKLESGIIGNINVSWSYYGEEDNSTVLYGTEGCMRIYDNPDYSIVIEKGNGQKTLYAIDKIQTNDRQNNSGVIDCWVSCLENKIPPEISGEEAFYAMKAVFAALESARTGHIISVDGLEV